MKKIISFILVCLAFVPTLLFAGCSNNDTDASAVKNTIYYVTSAQKDSVDTTETYVNANMKIIFYDDLFKVEYSDQNNQAEYHCFREIPRSFSRQNFSALKLNCILKY